MRARERERDAKDEYARTRCNAHFSLSLFILFSERRREEQNQKKCALLIIRDDQIETLGKNIKKHETYHFRVLPRRVIIILLDERNHILRRDWYGT